MGVSRRSFIKGSATTAMLSIAGGTLKPLAAAETELKPGPCNKWPGRVVVNFNKNAVTVTTVDEDVAKKMVDDAIMLLTGKESVGAAWKAVFPDTLSASSKIAIKTNILNAGLPCPHASTIQAITDGLLQMDLDGAAIPPGNITVYDGNNNKSFSDAKYSSDRFPGINLVKEKTFSKFGDGALNDRPYAKTLNESDFLINVFSPRGHMIGNGFTLGFKSHFGTYDDAPGMHGGSGIDNIVDINCKGPVYEKTVLSFCSGLFGMDEKHGPTGGADPFPTYANSVDSSIDKTNKNISPTTIILSTDPVSCDMQAVKIQRLNKGGKYGTDDAPEYLKIAAGLGGKPFNIGVIDEEQMDVRKIINGEIVTTGTAPRRDGIFASQKNDLTVSLSARNRTAFIEYTVSNSLVGKRASVEILDLSGRAVYNVSQAISGAKNHLSWNMRNSSGASVANGKYIVKVSAGKYRRSSTIVVK